MNKIARKSVISAVNLLACIIVAFVLMVAVFMIPVNRASNNLAASAPTLKEEGTYHIWFSWCHSQQDNWTDSIMLIESTYDTDNSAINKAMMVYRGSTGSATPCDDITSHYIDGTPYSSEASYARYWHGYLVILKPLLSLMTYDTIRILNGLLQIILFGITCMLMYRRGLKLHIVAYAISYLILMPVVLAMCLQYSTCYYAFTLGLIALLLIPSERLDDLSYLVFLNIGIFVAFFDFLTYPLITFGMPAIILMALLRDNTLPRKILKLITSGIFWVLGYALMWASKWGLATLITGTNVFDDAFDQVTKRTSSEMPDFLGEVSAFKCVLMNYKSFFKTPFAILFLIAAIALTIVLAMNLKKIGVKSALLRLAPYVLLSIMPIAWFLVTRNHSSVHFWFTNKICAISSMAILVGLLESVESVIFKAKSMGHD